MFHFKKTNLICAILFTIALVLVFLANLTPVLVFIALGIFSVAFGLLTYILFDEYQVYNQIQRETKYELLMELATTQNAEEYITKPDVFNSEDLKRLKSQKRKKLTTVIMCGVLCLAFLTLLILRLLVF